MNRLRSLGIALVYLGLSCRKAAEVLRFSDDASYEAVREWYHKAKVLLRAPPKRCRKEIAIDETKIKEGKGDVVLPLGGGRYGERGSARRGVELTLTRDGRDAYRFIKRALQACTNTPTVLADGGPWHSWALSRMGVPWDWVTFGKRNAVEQWFSVFKQRVKRFYRRWPHNARVETAVSWCEEYVALYNLGRV